MTYDEIRQAIIDECETEEETFLDNIPRFVRQAEQRVYRQVKLPCVRKTASAETPADSYYMDAPADMISVESLRISWVTDPNAVSFPVARSYRFLEQKDSSFIQEVFSQPLETGVPRYYSVHNDTTIMFGPPTSDVFPVELLYEGIPESIVEEGETWLSTRASNAILYGALWFAHKFLRAEADVLQAIDSDFKEALSGLMQIVGRSKTDAYRDKDLK